MDVLWQELSLGLAGRDQILRAVIRLVAAGLLSGVIGYFREREHKPAGMRTHMLVAMGTAGFVVASISYSMHEDAVSRVVQGIATGIGFIGAGSIIKLRDEVDVKGLTTAAGLWMTCAVGVLAGLGEVGIAIVVTVFALLVLNVLRLLEARLGLKPVETEGTARPDGPK